MTLQTLTRDQIAGLLGARLAVPLGLPAMPRAAACHPDRPVAAREKCNACYKRAQRRQGMRGAS